MTKSVKQIRKIKLNDSGLKGLEVSYLHPEEKNNLVWNNEHIEKRKHPIHSELESAILDLRNFALEICGYYISEPGVNEKNQLISDTSVTEILMSVDAFKISGEMRVIGDKFIKISTPEIESGDGYDHFETVMNIIKKITEETHEYMAGKKMLSNEEFLAKYAKVKGDDVMVKDFKNMSAKEKRDACTDILQKMGAIVIIDEDAEIESINDQLTIEESPVVEEPVAEIVPISTPVAEIIPTVIKEEIPIQPAFVPQPMNIPKF